MLLVSSSSPHAPLLPPTSTFWTRKYFLVVYKKQRREYYSNKQTTTRQRSGDVQPNRFGLVAGRGLIKFPIRDITCQMELAWPWTRCPPSLSSLQPKLRCDSTIIPTLQSFRVSAGLTTPAVVLAASRSSLIWCSGITGCLAVILAIIFKSLGTILCDYDISELSQMHVSTGKLIILGSILFPMTSTSPKANYYFAFSLSVLRIINHLTSPAWLLKSGRFWQENHQHLKSDAA